MNQPVYLKDVVTLKLDENKCVGCGMCLVVCPRAVFSLNNGTAEMVNRDACMECGACSRNCSAEALSVQSGVGCAAAVINVMLGRTNAPCCGPIGSANNPSKCSPDAKRTGCC